MADKLHISRRAKIVCTLGPSSNTTAKIKSLIQSGMNVARLNFSHGTHDQHRELIKKIRLVSDQMQKPIAILQDLQGPKIRVLTFDRGSINLRKGDSFTLTTRKIIGNKEIVSVSYPSLARDVKVGSTILLNDGLISLKVEKIEKRDVICRVIYGGTLSDHKGLNLPDNILSVSALTDKDLKDLDFGLKMNVDYVALSFVQNAKDILQLKKLIASAGKDMPVIAKIEKPQAVDSIDEIAEQADAIMVARGDLGVELSAEQVPPIQKRIIQICNMKGIPVITATQMLESMIQNPRPTRAEASDVANAILDGSDAVMLSAETASGKFPVKAVQTMQRIISLIEKKSPQINWEIRRRPREKLTDISSTIGFTACQAADLIDAAMIICPTLTGSTARMIARYRPRQPLIAITHSKSSLQRLNLIWGIVPYSVHEFGDNFDDAIKQIIQIIKGKKILKSGDKIVITAGLPFHSRRGSNMLRIEEISS